MAFVDIVVHVEKPTVVVKFPVLVANEALTIVFGKYPGAWLGEAASLRGDRMTVKLYIGRKPRFSHVCQRRQNIAHVDEAIAHLPCRDLARQIDDHGHSGAPVSECPLAARDFAVSDFRDDFFVDVLAISGVD